jgi:hypothetical protein
VTGRRYPGLGYEKSALLFAALLAVVAARF